MATAYYRHPRVLVNGVDITSLVREYSVVSQAGNMTVTTLTLLTVPTIDAEGTLSFQTRDDVQFVGPVPTPSGPMRAIHFRVEDDLLDEP